MTKQLKILITACCLLCNAVFAQVGMTSNMPDPSAVLDINASDKGLLIPRISLASTVDNNAINRNMPVESLMVYNTNVDITGDGAMGAGFYYWDVDVTPARWRRVITTIEGAWILGGNNNGTEKALGTLDKDFNGKGIELPFLVSNQEQIRVMQGNSGIGTADADKKSSLAIKYVPGGGDEDNVLVLRNGANNTNEVFQKDPITYKLDGNSKLKAAPNGGIGNIPLKVAYYGRSDSTHMLDMFYIRIARNGVYGMLAFSCQQSVSGSNSNYVLTYLGGGVEPIADAYRNNYKVVNSSATGSFQSNRLLLTYPNAPNIWSVTDVFNFEIWITVVGGTKYLNIQNLSTQTTNDDDLLWGNRSYYVVQQRVY
jgi:hypothetical protein